MAKTHSRNTQIDRSQERFTAYAAACREAASAAGLPAISPHASPAEVEMRSRCYNAAHSWWQGVTLLAWGLGGTKAIPVYVGIGFTLPIAPRTNGQSYEGDKGTRYNGPSKRTLKRRASRRARGA